MTRKVSAFFALAVLLGTDFAHADDTSALEGLLEEQIVTTASKSAESVTAAPALSRSISADEIRAFGMRSVAEAIDFLAFGMRTEKRLGTEEIGARGMLFAGDNGNHVLLLIDGHVGNEPLYGSARFGPSLALPLELVDHIEVIVGPGSVLYGSNAVLGVVNVVTKSASTHAGVHAALEITPLSSGRGTVTFGHTATILGTETRFTGGVGYYHQDGPPVTFAPQYTGLDALSGLPNRWSSTGPATGVWGGTVNRGFFKEVPGAYLRVEHGRLTLLARGAGLRLGDPTRAGDFDQPSTNTDEWRGSLSAAYRAPLGTVGTLTTRGFVDVFARDSHLVTSRASSCWYAFDRTCEHDHEGMSRRYGLELQSSFDWTHDGTWVTDVGATAMVNHVGARLSTTDFHSRREFAEETSILTNGDQVRRVLAANAQQVWRPLDVLTLNVGARVDADERFPAVLSPRVAASLSPWKGGTLRAIHSRAFRAPSYDETEGRGLDYVASSWLVPEKVESYEAAIEHRIGAHRTTFGFFDMHFDDVIEREQLPAREAATAIAAGATAARFATEELSVYRLRNTVHAETTGFTAAVEGAALETRLRYGASFTAANARNTDGDPITVAPSASGNARVAYAFPDKWPTLAVASTFASKALVDRAIDGGFSPRPYAPPQLELRATLTGEVPWVPRLGYRVIASHAFHDRTAYAVGPTQRALSATAQPELAPVVRTSVTLGLQYDF